MHLIKGHNSVVSEWNYPTWNPIPLLTNTNVYANVEIGKKVLKLEHGNKVQSIFDIHQGP